MKFILLLLIAVLLNIKSFAQSTQITVQGDEVGDYLYPFWAGVTFHPTEYLSTSWGKNLLTELAETKAIQTYVRIYNQPEFASRVNKNGTISYNWQHFDERVQTILELGLKPIVVFYSMPQEISEDTSLQRTRAFGSKLFIGPPKDYGLWEEMCRDFVRHITGKYGKEEVASWYYRCWNEPNHEIFWHNEDMEEYFKLYDHFAAAVKSVNPELRIGGPAVTSTDTYKDPTFYRSFLAHVARGKNHATGKKGTPLDYIGVHTYGGSGSHGGPGYEHPSIKYMFSLQEKLATIRDEFKELRGKPILIEEWGISSAGTKGIGAEPMAEVRNSQYGAAFLVSLAAQHLYRENKLNLNINQYLFCASGYEGNRPRNFNGYRTFTTNDDIVKPIFNSYQLMGKLGDRLLEHQSEGGENIFVIPTTKEDGSLSIIITHFDESAVYNEGDSVSIKLLIKKEWNIEKLQLKHWRIDKTHSNAFTAFQQMGSPDYLNPIVKDQLKASMQLEKLRPDAIEEANSEIEMEFSLPVNSVSLVELIPMYEN